MAAVNPDEVGKAFATHFYNLFDNNRPAMTSLFQDQSMITFEGKQFLGGAAAVQHLMSLGTNVKHQPQQVFAQPTFNGALLLLVIGNIYIDSPNPVRFSDVFTLVPAGGSFWVYNAVLSLNYG